MTWLVFYSLIDWASFNCMQASLDKFQAIAVGQKKNTFEMHPAFNVESVNITCEVVKLLGVDIDFKF